MAAEWITLTAQAEGNDHDGFRVVNYWDGRKFPDKPAAVANGFTQRGSDDFNVALIEGDRLVSLWWMDHDIGEDAATLADIAREIGLART
jgi:hypothetical protein